jgi:hypothetical protein
MINKTVRRALKKLKKPSQRISGQPAIIVVEYPFAMLAPGIVEEHVLRCFEDLADEARHCSAIVFVTTWQDVNRLQISPHVVANPFAAVAASALPWSILHRRPDAVRTNISGPTP